MGLQKLTVKISEDPLHQKQFRQITEYKSDIHISAIAAVVFAKSKMLTEILYFH